MAVRFTRNPKGPNVVLYLVRVVVLLQIFVHWRALSVIRKSLVKLHAAYGSSSGELAELTLEVVTPAGLEHTYTPPPMGKHVPTESGSEQPARMSTSAMKHC